MPHVSTSRRLRRVLVVAALLAPGSVLLSQVPDTARANRGLARLTAKLHADQTLPDSLRRLTAADLLNPENSNHAALLDDSTASLLLKTMAATTRQVPESLCGSFLGGSPVPAGDLDIMLPYADSTTLENWLTILERIVRARAQPVAGRRIASDSMLRVAFLSVYARLDTASQRRLIRVAQNPPPSRSDACWSLLAVMDGLAALPVADAGPVVRAMFGQAAAPPAKRQPGQE